MKIVGVLLFIIIYHSNLFAFTTPNSFSPGTKISSSEMNNNFQAIESELNDRTAQTLLKLNADITLTATCTPVPLTSSEISDVENDGNYSNGVYTASKKGVYFFISVQSIQTTNYYVGVYKNGTFVSSIMSYNVSTYLPLDVGDSVELKLTNGSMYCATAQNLLQSDTFFIIKKVANLP